MVPRDVAVLNRAVVVYLAAVAIQYVFGRLVIMAVARIGEGFLRELRERVFAHLMKQSIEFYDRNRTGVLVSRMTADIESLQELVSQGLSMFIVNMLVLVGAIVVMVIMSWQLALGRPRRRAGAGQGVELVPAGVEPRVPASCARTSAAH